MAFDANLVFHDGAEITATVTPISLARTNGSIVLEIKETPAKGLSVVMIVTEDIDGATDTLQVTIEESAGVNGTYVEVARFPLLVQGTGMPGTYIRRFDSNKAFVRALLTATDVGGGAGFSLDNCHILLASAPFINL